jgi:AraC family transcriptional regulator
MRAAGAWNRPPAAGLPPGEAILDIALATGFGSGEAFARAFKLKFGCTPTAWRRRPQKRCHARGHAPAPQDSNPDQAMRNRPWGRRPNFQHPGLQST